MVEKGSFLVMFIDAFGLSVEDVVECQRQIFPKVQELRQQYFSLT